MYLLNEDLKNHQSEHTYQAISDFDNNQVLTLAKAAAIEQARSYIKARYDDGTELKPFTKWVNNVAYIEGDRVFIEDQQTGELTLYSALNDNTGVDPSGLGQTDWEQGDTRNQWLLMIICDLCVYHLYTKIPKRRTPEDVNDRYLDAVNWLKGVSSGEINPDLPAIPEEDERETTFPQFGGHERIGNDW